MKLLIVVQDSVVAVDGIVLKLDLTAFDLTNIWCIRWEDDAGELEYSDTRPNDQLSSIETYQPIIDAHAAELAINNAPPSLADRKEQAYETLKSLRKEFELTSFVHNSIACPIGRTERTDISSLTLGYTSGLVPAETVTRYKIDATTRIVFNGSAEFLPFAMAVMGRSQQLFQIEEDLDNQVNGMTEAELDIFDPLASFQAMVDTL